MTLTASEQNCTHLTSFPCVNFGNDMRLLGAIYQVQAIMSTFFCNFFEMQWFGAGPTKASSSQCEGFDGCPFSLHIFKVV